MYKICERIFIPQNIIWIIVLSILLIGKFGLKFDYISVKDIIMNHLECFRGSNGKLKKILVINYIFVPFLMGIATTLSKEIDEDTINIITIIISILTAMLFTLLTLIIEMKAKINQDTTYFSSEAKISKKSLIETYYTVMFEILVSIILLILCFFNCFTKSFGYIQSFLIYSLTYLLIINLLMIIKRIFRVIDTDIKK